MTRSVILFDLNGTLTDPSAIGEPWRSSTLGADVLALAVQTAMVDTILNRFSPFAEHIDSALHALVAERGLDPARIAEAMERAAALPPFPDTAAGLDALGSAGHRLTVLTNSGQEAGRRTLQAAGLRARFEGVLGVDGAQKFKPHPDTYAYALRELGCEAAEVTFVTAHAWDMAGAAHAGMRTALVRRGEPLPPVLPAPDLQAPDLRRLAERLSAPPASVTRTE
jgi:2-haloacid dehalogenase